MSDLPDLLARMQTIIELGTEPRDLSDADKLRLIAVLEYKRDQERGVNGTEVQDDLTRIADFLDEFCAGMAE